MLILVENQYAVGDSIQVGGVSGEVERLTLRTTHVRDINGHLHIVPNGEVRVVANMTRDWSRALVDVGIGYEENLERVLSILGQLAEAFAHDSAFGPDLLEPPEVVGPLTLRDWAITVRLQVRTQPGKQWAVARELQRRIHAKLAQEGIATPYPRQDIWVRDLGSPATRMNNDLKAREAT
jgi:small conductance mechanosensitive channel